MIEGMQQTAHHHSPTPSGVHLHTEGFAHPRRNVAILGIEHGMKVADFGSGSGAYALAIAEWLSNSGHVYAIDIQRDLLKRTQNEATRRKLKNISVVWGDLEVYGGSKIADRHVDLVLVSNLLFQVGERPAVIAEARRILKPTGRLVIIDWSDSFKGMGPHRDDVVTKDAALGITREGGFDLLREFSPGAHHYGLMLRPTHIS